MRSPSVARSPGAAGTVQASLRKATIMNFVSLRLITDDTSRLVRFYEAVTGRAAT